MRSNEMIRGETPLTPTSYKQVVFNGGFWESRQQLNRQVTLQAEYEQLKVTGRISSLKQQWKPGDPQKPHHYWDSDIAKWIEAAAFSLAAYPDATIEKKIDDLIALMTDAQWADGYFNTYFTSVEPGNRWTNVYVMHELYCAGHLIEAAVAYYDATGKNAFLYLMMRYADYIVTVFGPDEEKIHGYPGHEEIELALIKLYRTTGRATYLELAKYFIDERGKKPHFFESEARSRGEDPDVSPAREILNRNYLTEGPYALFQAHTPVRKQKTAEGHAVRAMYLYSAMADVATETQDAELLETCRILWDNVTQRRMSVTGGIGALEFGERFTFDYDLPNETVYNETCASIGLIFWAHRMLQVEKDSRYADIMEQTLYNGVLSGVSLTGDRFFYSNHLACCPDVFRNRIIRNPRLQPERQSWFEVSCCPPNLARLIASLGQYFYSSSGFSLYVHMYAGSRMETTIGNHRISLEQQTKYPWDGKIAIKLGMETPTSFTLCLRIPHWCSNPSFTVNGAQLAMNLLPVRAGYAAIGREWGNGDVVDLVLPMPVLFLESHPKVRQNTGRVALQRGPLIYCFEEIDNGTELWDVRVDTGNPPAVRWEPNLLGGVVTLVTEGSSRSLKQWEGSLYQSGNSAYQQRKLVAIPYYAWSNRGVGEMIVWVQKG